MNQLNSSINIAVRSFLLMACAWIFAACVSLDLSAPGPERTARVVTEDAVRLTFINDYEFDDSVGSSVYVEAGDLQIYFNVRLPEFTAKNMGVTIGASSTDTILVCAGSLREVARPAAYRLREMDAETASIARARKSLCDRLTRR